MASKVANRCDLLDDGGTTSYPEPATPGLSRPALRDNKAALNRNSPTYYNNIGQKTARDHQPVPNTLTLRENQGPPTSSARSRPILKSPHEHPTPGYRLSISPTINQYRADTRRHTFPENWCGVCQSAFPTRSALISHAKSTPKHSNFCSLCKRIFKDRNGLQNHIDNAIGHEIFCNLCLSAFKDVNGLRNHFENNYVVGHEFACLVCLLGFWGREELHRHLVTAKKHVWCTKCDRRFPSQDSRDEHWVNTKKHKHCLQPGCEFDGRDLTELNKHIEENHFRCENCRQIFPSLTKLVGHLKNCFRCSECGYRTRAEGNMMNHMVTHQTPTLPCWACAQPMLTHASLVNHLESGTCPTFPKPYLLTSLLGSWWYSTIFMDPDVHFQLRTGRVEASELSAWVSNGALKPFICRHVHCYREFGRFSSLILHVESQACGWNVEKLRITELRKLFEERFGSVQERLAAIQKSGVEGQQDNTWSSDGDEDCGVDLF
ncbi:hypothetical protein K469DRAFT_669727 [Zopfia rhizophila CBS 207.26]|uniref:C2H2-type domain-containing protein n=1 Tax=Zopfia rhizophila CBS 207.26 TaxID=1314779 RepID=A0A6A6DRY1_9PEZI|nr:hypothetical protein K469DRAFT_669727 [Zopfia rhizophila CBS 207.26]